VFHFAGDYLSVRTLTQSVPAEGVAGDTYVFGCWIQCYGIPQVNTTYNIRRITLNIINGSTVVNTKAVNMNVDTDEWQFMAAALTATGAYTQLQLTIEYTDSASRARQKSGVWLFAKQPKGERNHQGPFGTKQYYHCHAQGLHKRPISEQEKRTPGCGVLPG
jgi:hypothetical protein